ncbi:MAG: hypothetical protein H6581_28395 [Bacteroidia bacterium]|nr:hypothetical protein [Bacteroidia bacterium]
MICFENRESAGRALGEAILSLSPQNPVILGVAAGGIPVAAGVARALGEPLEAIISKKVHYPGEPGAIMGAISEDGNYYLAENAKVSFSQKALQRILAEQKPELDERVRQFRSGRPFPAMEGRTALIIDEGFSNGAAIVPLIQTCRRQGAAAVWIAAPVGGASTCTWLESHADKVVVLKQPKLWVRIEDCYENYHKYPRTELVEMLGNSGQGR